MKKVLSFLLILSILVVQIDFTKKEAQAVLPAAVIGISYVAAAMVAAGATGYVQMSVEGEFYGDLWESAKATYYAMNSSLQQSLNTALAVSSYVAMSSVPGLWDFLHSRFIDDSLVPKVSEGMSEFESYSVRSFPSTVIPYLTIGSQIYFTENAEYITLQQYAQQDGNSYLQGSFTKPINGMVYTVSLITLADGYSSDNVGRICFRDTAGEIHSSYYLSGSLYPYVRLTSGQYGGVAHVSFALPATGISITSDMPINPPADPVALNLATISTTYPDRNGVVTSPSPTPEQQQDTDELNQDRAAAAAAAAAAAIAAALAAGHSQAAADAAGAAASAAIYAGQTAAQAAAAGAAAAIAYVSSTTGTLTTDIANTKTGDALDFTKLKFAANLFTNKFPFSLPWDLKNMLNTFGSGSTTAPVIELGFLDARIDLSQFNSIASAVRVLELFAFGVALLFGTRKLLGGAS